MVINVAEQLSEKLMEKEWLIDGNLYYIGDWSFGFNNAIKRLGVCKPSKKRIELSRKYVLSNNVKNVEQTIRHEIAHAIDVKIRGYSNHDNVWKSIAKQCGCDAKREGHSDYDLETTYKWHGVCSNHGVLARWSRKPKDNKRCRKCGTKVSIELNKNYIK